MTAEAKAIAADEREVTPKEASLLTRPQREEVTIRRYARRGLIKARQYPEGLKTGRLLVTVRRGAADEWQLVELSRPT